MKEVLVFAAFATIPICLFGFAAWLRSRHMRRGKIKDRQIKILLGALEAIIDITHCTCDKFKHDPAMLCPICLAIAAVDEAEKLGKLPE